MSKPMLRVLLLGLLLGTGAVKAAVPENYSMVLLTENFPPFNMAVDEKNFAKDDGIDGISTDIVREMFKRAGIKYSLSLRFPWDRLYSLTLEKPDYALFSTSRTPAREAQFKWVGPLGKTRKVLMSTNTSNVKISNLEGAAKYKVGTYKSSAVSQILTDKKVPFAESLRDQENVSKLEKGEIDLWATTDVVARYLAKQEGVSDLQTALVIDEADLYLAINKDTSDEVVQKLQQTLDQMRQEGVVDQITNNYL
jgi:polar amino acid transport system substrate-binding protein